MMRIAMTEEIPEREARAFDTDDVHTAALQDFNSGIYALAPRLNATLLPEGKNIRHRGRMLVIRMLIQIPL